MKNLNVSARASDPQRTDPHLATRTRKFPYLLGVIGLAMVVLAAWVNTDQLNAQGTVPPGGTLPVPGVVLLSLGSSGELESDSDELEYRDEDIIIFSPDSGALDIYFDGSAYGLQALDLRDFELLEEGGFIFTGNKPITIDNPNGSPTSLEVDDSDIVRYDPSTDSFSIYLAGNAIGLTTDGEDIDALAFAPDNRLLISTIGAATFNGPAGEVEANDEDLVACDLGASPVTCVLYFEGSDVALTRGSEDLMSAWVDPIRSQTHFFSTKGRYVAEGSRNSVEEDKEVVFGCTPLSAEESTGLTDCDFFLFLDTEEAFDTEKQIDGMWLGAAVPLAAPVRATDPANYDLSSEAALDNEEIADVLADESADTEVDLYDFVEMVEVLYLPIMRR